MYKSLRRKLALFVILSSFIFLNSASVYAKSIDDYALHKIETKEKNISLTFDLNWGTTVVKQIINVLEKEKLKATFFVSGNWAERHPDIFQDIISSGHEVGLLGYHGKSYALYTEKAIHRDISRGIDVFRKLGVKDIKYIRANSSYLSEKYIQIAKLYHLQVVTHSVNSFDWKPISNQTIIHNTTVTVDRGDILLMHASDRALRTPDVLPEIHEILAKKNLNFVTLSELITNASKRTKYID